MLRQNRLRDLLCTFSGEDLYIMYLSKNNKVKNGFAFIGAFVVLIFLLCLFSAFILSNSLFPNSPVLDTVIGLFWGITVSNIYVFLLYTFAPTILPSKHKKGKKEMLTQALTQAELKKINIWSGGGGSLIFKFFFLLIISINTGLPLYYKFIGETENSFLFEIKRALNGSGFFSFIGIIYLFFLVPVAVKYLIRTYGSFYNNKQRTEKRIVKEEYEAYKIKYVELLATNQQYWLGRIHNNMEPLITQIDKFSAEEASKLRKRLEKELKPKVFERYESWEDHPYNTIKKENTIKHYNEVELISSVYES